MNAWRKTNLEPFLKTLGFDYAVVPDQGSFMRDELQVQAYPTHCVTDKNGKIASKSTNYKEMVYALAKATSE